MARRGAGIGGLSNGGFVLARAGLLNGYRATVHWEDFASFCELYPRVGAVYARYVSDRNRFTCSGGASTIDLFLEMVEERLGVDVSTRIAEQIHLTTRRQGGEIQGHRFGLGGRPLSPVIAKLVADIEASIDWPESVTEMAKQSALSARQLRRVFIRETGYPPNKFLRHLRLDRAHSLVMHTNLRMADIAAATGFGTASRFGRSYRKRFGLNPSSARKSAQSTHSD